MVALKTQFDGERIVVPNELRGTRPGEVIVIFQEQPDALPARPSVFDAIGRAPQPRSAEEIDAQVRAERDAWGGR